jgi:ABC-type transport system substrate-binding protein
MNAAAVKFSSTARSGVNPCALGQPRRSLSGAEVVDDLTVDVVTKEPYGPIRTLAAATRASCR